MRVLLGIIAVSYLLNSAFMLVAPLKWYNDTPGVSMLGSYNTHFVRDVGLVYLVSAIGFLLGLHQRSRTALFVAALWPALHAIYHFWMWIGRDFALDVVALVNLTAIQLPAWIGLWAAITYGRNNTRSSIMV